MNDEHPGTIYLLHFDGPLGHAGHYLGWTADESPDDRISYHLCGRGSKLVRAAVLAGCRVSLVATWVADRTEERRMKNCKNHRKFCPKCRPGYLQEQRKTCASTQAEESAAEASQVALLAA